MRQPASESSFSQAISRANAAELYAAVAWVSGVASVMPDAVVARSDSACSTRVIVAAGTSVVVVGGGAVVALVGTLEATDMASANAACAAANSCSALTTSSCAVVTASAAVETDSRGASKSAPPVLTSPTVALSSVKSFP